MFSCSANTQSNCISLKAMRFDLILSKKVLILSNRFVILFLNIEFIIRQYDEQNRLRNYFFVSLPRVYKSKKIY